tara:strand:- start:2819 stop:3244 length:426 start_codon:yes stop_codon:yes gene_type:complete
MFENLNNDNWLLYAFQNYRMKEHTTTREFWSDVNITKYINRHFNNYRRKKTMKSRLCMNHIIIYFNVFQFEAAQRLLFYKTSPENWSLLKMFLLLLNRCPRKVVGINGSTIMVGDIEMEDEACQLVLQDLDKGSNGQWSLP